MDYSKVNNRIFKAFLRNHDDFQIPDNYYKNYMFLDLFQYPYSLGICMNLGYCPFHDIYDILLPDNLDISYSLLYVPIFRVSSRHS